VWPWQSLNIVPALLSSKTLTHLTLTTMRCRHSTPSHLFDGLKGNTTLKYLAFCDAFFTDVRVSDAFQTQLFAALCGNTPLQHLTLLRCTLHNLPSTQICLPAFVRSNPSLRSLNIMGNSYGCEYLLEIVTAFVDSPGTEDMQLSLSFGMGHGFFAFMNERIGSRLGRFHKNIEIEMGDSAICNTVKQKYLEYLRLVEENDRQMVQIVRECILLQQLLQKSAVFLPEHIHGDFALFCNEYMNP
jgi:hypothetical protein